MTTPSTESIWRRLHEELRGFLRRRVRDGHLVDDLLQETFVRIHRSAGALAQEDRLRAWVFQIARHVLADHRRAEGARPAGLDPDAAAPAENRGDDDADDARCTWVMDLLDRLPEPYREPLRLLEVDGLSQVAIAERLGLSRSGARTRVQRGRELLRRELEACCRFELDRRGGIIEVIPRAPKGTCDDC